MSHDPEDWWIIWRKTDLLFQEWQKFGYFWPEYSKVSQICALIGFYCAKYLMFDRKKYRGFIFHDNEEWCKNLKKNWLAVWKITWRVWQIVTRALESAKIGILWHPFVQGRKCMSLQFTVELCVMTMKNDTKVEKELICRFKIDRGILTNIDLITRKSPKFAL